MLHTFIMDFRPLHCAGSGGADDRFSSMYRRSWRGKRGLGLVVSDGRTGKARYDEVGNTIPITSVEAQYRSLPSLGGTTSLFLNKFQSNQIN